MNNTVEKIFDTNTSSNVLKVKTNSSLILNSVNKINSYLISSQKNKFNNNSLNVESIVNYLNKNISLKVYAHIVFHLVVAFASVFFIYIQFQLQYSSTILSSSIGSSEYSELLTNLATYNEFYIFVFIEALLLMSVEYFFWIYFQSKMHDDKLSFLTKVDELFIDGRTVSMSKILYDFTAKIEDQNKIMTSNNTFLDENIKGLVASINNQGKVMNEYSIYLKKLESLKVEDVIVNTVKLSNEMKSCLETAAKHFPAFSSLSQHLSDLLNRSISLYEKLNEAISRDDQFKSGIQVYNDATKNNGHITAKLLETMNKVQTHINQVLIVHGPKIEALDKSFFDYLQQRHDLLKQSLQKSDDLFFSRLKELSINKIENEK